MARREPESKARRGLFQSLLRGLGHLSRARCSTKCCFAEPGPLRTPPSVRPRLSSAPRREVRRAAQHPGNAGESALQQRLDQLVEIFERDRAFDHLAIDEE